MKTLQMVTAELNAKSYTKAITSLIENFHASKRERADLLRKIDELQAREQEYSRYLQALKNFREALNQA